jgi:hypothetical protein
VLSLLAGEITTLLVQVGHSTLSRRDESSVLVVRATDAVHPTLILANAVCTAAHSLENAFYSILLLTSFVKEATGYEVSALLRRALMKRHELVLRSMFPYAALAR